MHCFNCKRKNFIATKS